MVALPSIFSSLTQASSAVTITVTIDGKDVSQQLGPSLLNLIYKESYKDNVVSDTLDFSIADPEGLFRQTFKLNVMMPVTCSISSGSQERVLGKMYIKSVRIEGSKQAGTTVKLSCTSIPPQSPFRLEKRSSAYPIKPGTKIKLSELSGIIAKQDKLKISYKSAVDPQIARVDQHDHSDQFILHKLCKEHDFNMKVVDDTLTVIDNKTVEQQSAEYTIVCPTKLNPGGFNGSGMEKWEFREETEDCQYSGSTAIATDPISGKAVEGTAVDPDSDGPYFNDPTNPHSDATQQDQNIEPESTID